MLDPSTPPRYTHTSSLTMTFSVFSRNFLAVVALASVVAAAPGGGARRSFANKDGVVDSATRVGVRITHTDVDENELCSSRLNLHSWSKNHVRARRFLIVDRTLTLFDSSPSFLKATSPTAPPVAPSSRSARPNTSSSPSSAAPASTARPAASSFQGPSSRHSRTSPAASSRPHGRSSATRRSPSRRRPALSLKRR
jgi:hypothetical protein